MVDDYDQLYLTCCRGHELPETLVSELDFGSEYNLHVEKKRENENLVIRKSRLW